MSPILKTGGKNRFLPLALVLVSLVLAACAGAITVEELSSEPSPVETQPIAAQPTESQSTEIAYRFTLPSGTDGDVSLASYVGDRNVILVFTGDYGEPIAASNSLCCGEIMTPSAGWARRCWR